MPSGNGSPKTEAFSWKQKLILMIFFLEVLIYPFIVASQLTGEGLEANLENEPVRRGILIVLLWTPIAVVLGVILGRRLRNNPEIIEFFKNRDVTADEVAPTVGIFAPLAVIAAWLVVFSFWALLHVWVISIPIYLIIRYWKKKGIRAFVRWVFRLVMKIALKLKRMSYLGYFFPIIFGTFFANAITQNTKANSGGTYILILIQMVVLVSLWKHIRRPLVEHELPIPATGQPQVPSPEIPTAQSNLQSPQAIPSYRHQPLPAHTPPQQYVPPVTPPPPNYPLPSTPPLPSSPALPSTPLPATSPPPTAYTPPPTQTQKNVPSPSHSQGPPTQPPIQSPQSVQPFQPHQQPPGSTNIQQPTQQPLPQQNLQDPQVQNLGTGEPKGKKKGLFRRK